MTFSAVTGSFRISSRAFQRPSVASKAFTLHVDGRSSRSYHHKEQHQQSNRRQYHHRGRRSQFNENTYTAIPIFSFLFPAFWRSGSDQTDLSPFKYTTHRVSSIKRISPQHVLIDIPISPRSREAFRNGASTGVESSSQGSGVVDVWHVYVKSPDLQIERPYTPINDVERDGYARLLVKRVKGGEVGRYVLIVIRSFARLAESLIHCFRYLHSLKEGDDVEIRGPIRTVSVPVESLDHLTMVLLSVDSPDCTQMT